MAINTQLTLAAALPSLTGAPGLLKKTGTGLFEELLASQVTINPASATMDSSENTGDAEDSIDRLKKKGCIGFFKNLEKEKLEKLREKILEEMKLTEDALSKLPPAQRAAIEQRISEEIQRRMALGSMDKDSMDENSPALQNALGMGKLLRSFGSNDVLEQPASLITDPLSKSGQADQEE